MTKCIGIISYFPEGELREIRISHFKRLMNVLNNYFKLPIIIIAQNWRECDFKIDYCNSIKVYAYPHGLGITRARIELRKKLLLEDYDAHIYLEDDADIECTAEGAENYLKEVSADKVMMFDSIWFRLISMPKKLTELMDFDYIAGYESCRGELWEDCAWNYVYKKLYPELFGNFSKKGIKINFTRTEENQAESTWYNDKCNNMREKSIEIGKKWLYDKMYRNHQLLSR